MEPEGTRLSEISQTKTDKYRMISFIREILKMTNSQIQGTHWWSPEAGAGGGDE